MKQLLLFILLAVLAGGFLLTSCGTLFGGSSSACVEVDATSGQCGPVPSVGNAIGDAHPGNPDPNDGTITWRSYSIPLDSGCSQVGSPLAIQDAPLSMSGVTVKTGIVVAAVIEDCGLGQDQAVVQEVDYSLNVPQLQVNGPAYGLLVTRVAVQTLPAFTFGAKSADGNQYSDRGVQGPRGEWTYGWTVEAMLAPGSTVPVLTSLTQEE